MMKLKDMFDRLVSFLSRPRPELMKIDPPDSKSDSTVVDDPAPKSHETVR